MSLTGALVAFAADFALFLVALGGVALSRNRTMLVAGRVARGLLGVGFGALAAGALLRGASVVEDADATALLVLRFTGIALVGTGLFDWVRGARGRLFIGAGLVGLGVGEALVLADRGAAGDVVVLLGALVVGFAMVRAAARSITARIAASGAAVLLVVVVAVSVALSAVVADNVEDEAMERYGNRVETRAELAQRTATESSSTARTVAGAFSARQGDALAVALRALVAEGTDPAALRRAREAVGTALATVAGPESLSVSDPLLFVTPDGVPEAAESLEEASLRIELAGSAVVADAIADQSERQSVVVAGDQAAGVAAAPVTLDEGTPQRTFVGVVVAVRLLDDTYLRLLPTEEVPLSLSLVGREGVLVADGPQPSAGLRTELAGRVLDEGATPTVTRDERLVVARPVLDAAGQPTLAIVGSVPSDVIDQTRQDLFRTLFLVALGGGVVALLLSALVGQRIGSGVRRLTAAATRIQEGDFDAAASVDSADELGVLGTTFDSMAGSIRTMTGELRQAADDEARLRARLEAVVAGMGEALVAVDGTGRITDFNTSAEVLLGAPAAQVRGRLVGDVLTLVDEGGIDLTDRLGAVEDEAWTAAATVRARDAKVPVPVRVSAGALRSPDGSTVGGVFVLRDERREREVEQMKTDFLAKISHELRTPLTPIKGYARVLADRDVSAERTRTFAGEINVGVDQLERVIDQLVNFATVAAGRLELRVEPVSVRDLLDGTVRRWEDRLGDDHRLTRRVARGVPMVQVDRRHLEQSLDELVDNALKYSPDGGKVRLSATAVDDGRRRSVRLSVTDPGVGMPEGGLDAVVGDFGQGDASATRRFGGLGLGLTLVDRIVRAHGGRLECTPAVGGGTQVTIVVPAVDDDTPSPNGARRTRPLSAERPRGQPRART